MIVSVSRRTDIPAFYSEWFYNRLKEGFVYVINPMNCKQVSRIELNPQTVDCFVFWTKDPQPMMDRIEELKEYNFYFQYTITGYKSEVEKGLRAKNEIIKTFIELSKKIGKEKMVLRYDPIFLSEEYTIEYHCKAFLKLCTQLKGYTDKCVISFLDMYKKTLRNTKELSILPTKIEDVKFLAEQFSIISRANDIQIETCSEKYDLSRFNIKHGKCIDDKLISEVIGYGVNVQKDDTQREVCGCVKSIDIGQYNTCKHHCLYCYANYSYSQVESNIKMHDENYPLLIGMVREDAKITKRSMKSIKGARLGQQQLSLIDEK